MITHLRSGEPHRLSLAFVNALPATRLRRYTASTELYGEVIVRSTRLDTTLPAEAPHSIMVIVAYDYKSHALIPPSMTNHHLTEA